MKTINPRGVMPGTMLIATAVASVLLAACAAAPVKPDGAAEARNKLTQLQSDPNLASRAPVAIRALPKRSVARSTDCSIWE